jgi:hypothetical protein
LLKKSHIITTIWSRLFLRRALHFRALFLEIKIFLASLFLSIVKVKPAKGCGCFLLQNNLSILYLIALRATTRLFSKAWFQTISSTYVLNGLIPPLLKNTNRNNFSSLWILYFHILTLHLHHITHRRLKINVSLSRL